MEENLRNKPEDMQDFEDDFKDFDENDAPLSSEDIELAEANNVLLWDREVLRDILYKVDSQWKELLEHLIKF